MKLNYKYTVRHKDAIVLLVLILYETVVDNLKSNFMKFYFTYIYNMYK